MLHLFPLQVRIENTNLCNAFCTICPREKLTRRRGTMGVDLYKNIMRQLKEGGTKELHLQGYGEPFMDNTIIEKIRLAKEAGIPYTFMVTNASFLDESVSLEILNSGLDKLKISFYGLNREEYEGVHRGLSFEEVKANVERLLKLKKKLGKKTPVISLKYIGSLHKFLVFALRWGSRARVSYARLHNYGYGRRFNRARVGRKDRTCPIVERPIMQVLWDGLVVPCCYDFDGRVVLGDLSKESVRDVWNGERYRGFREMHRKREYEKIPVCFNCDKLR
ncbi:MAG: SPASM domain-containing protein [Deltaproteobacteria bacterium]|nr:SPASM domain-containing protein [Deltaproteobacteria bacterium]